LYNKQLPALKKAELVTVILIAFIIY